MVQKTLGVVSLLLLACACSKGESNDLLSHTQNSGASQRAEQGSLGCDREGDCSPSVGLLTIMDSDQVNSCAATLVGKDVVATASHCLPEELRTAGKSCSGQLWMHFAAAANYPESHIECLEVLSASDFSDRTRAQPDVALLKLVKPAQRPALEIDHSGFKDGARYTVYKVEPIGTESVVRARIKKVECIAVAGSEALPGYSSHLSSVASLADCNIEAINAGSPAIDSEGQIHGIIQAPISRSRLVKRANGRKLLEPNLTAMSLVTNFACFRGFSDNATSPLPPSCEDDPNEPNLKGLKDLNQRLDSQLTQSVRFENYFTPPAIRVRWHARAFARSSDEARAVLNGSAGPDFELYALPVPFCMKDNIAVAGLNFTLPVFGIGFGMDRYLRTQLDTSKYIGQLQARIEVDVKHTFLGTDDGGQKVATLYVQSFSGRWTRVSRTPLSLCPSP